MNEVRLSYRAVSSTTTLTPVDHFIEADATGGNFSIFLPETHSVGETYILKRIDSTFAITITIDGNGSTIDGSANDALANQWETIEVVSNGTSWLKVTLN